MSLRDRVCILKNENVWENLTQWVVNVSNEFQELPNEQRWKTLDLSDRQSGTSFFLSRKVKVPQLRTRKTLKPSWHLAERKTIFSSFVPDREVTVCYENSNQKIWQTIGVAEIKGLRTRFRFYYEKKHITERLLRSGVFPGKKSDVRGFLTSPCDLSENYWRKTPQTLAPLICPHKVD